MLTPINFKDLQSIRAFSKKTFIAGAKNEIHRLGAWPQLASDRANQSGHWLPAKQSGEEIIKAFPVNRYYDIYSNDRIDLSERNLEFSPEGWRENPNGQLVMSWLEPTAKWQAHKRYYQYWRQWQENIPPQFRQLVKQLKTHQIAALRCLAACPASYALAKNNPAIFILLALPAERAAVALMDVTEITRLLSRPQRQIIGHCFLYGNTNRARRFLKKIPLEHLHVDLLATLVRALDQPYFGHCLPHLKGPLDEAVLDLLADEKFWPFLSPQIINEVAKSPAAFYLFLQNIEIDRLLKLKLPRRCHSLGELSWLVQRSALPASVSHEDLPSPPVAGNKFLIPLSTRRGVIDESTRQQNCVRSIYLPSIISGGCYVYQLIKPERCTVLIKRIDAGRWFIWDIRTHADGIPRFSTVLQVVKWLHMPAMPVWYPQAWWNDGVPFPFGDYKDNQQTAALFQ